jgi:tetratricopeptide (TPR) repeat protein
VSAPDYFVDLARAKLTFRTVNAALWGDDRYIGEHLDSISFIDGAVAIQKKKPRDIAPALAHAEQYLETISTLPVHLFRLADYILRHNGPLDHAERALRKAVTLGGSNDEALRKLADVLSRQGRLDEAAGAACEVTQLSPNDHTAWGALAYAEQRRGRTVDAIAALGKAVSLNSTWGDYHDQLGHLLQLHGDLTGAVAAAQKAAHLKPEYEPWQLRVAELERLVAIG